jgi:acetyl esterase/lipase
VAWYAFCCSPGRKFAVCSAARSFVCRRNSASNSGNYLLCLLIQNQLLTTPQHGNICIPTAGSEGQAVPAGTSEDCLFLDVYAPTAAVGSKKLPVFFWIQGGGFAANTNANYNGTGLIEASGNNIVVVTFNYRVGPYGFLAGEEVERGASLNNGLKDQRKALKWVQQHISKVSRVIISPALHGLALVFLSISSDTLSSLAEIPTMLFLVAIVQVLLQ